MATPILNFSGDANVKLTEATQAYKVAVADYNRVVVDVKSIRAAILNLQAKMKTEQFSELSVSGRKLRAEAQAALDGYAKQLHVKAEEATRLQEVANKAQANVTFWQKQVQARKELATQKQTEQKGSAPVKTATKPASTAAPVISAPMAETPIAEAPETGPDIIVVAPSKPKLVEFSSGGDPRVRLSAFVGQETQIYGDLDSSNNLLSCLHATKGLLFPYTPGISVSQDTSWEAAPLQQTPFDILSYSKSSSASISINAKFTVQNQREGEYMMAAIHFFRSVSKMYFGETSTDAFLAQVDQAGNTTQLRQAGRAGLPPPVLILSGYGDLLFNNIRCVVRSHSWSFDENADMVKVDVLGGKATVWLPPVLQISIGLGIQMNADDMRRVFNLDDFRSGKLLLGDSKGWF